MIMMVLRRGLPPFFLRCLSRGGNLSDGHNDDTHADTISHDDKHRSRYLFNGSSRRISIAVRGE